MVSDPLTVACYRPAEPRGGLDSPMLIVCPNCATSYQVEPSSLGATGRSVRCVRCQKVWFAANTEAHGGDRPLPSAGHGGAFADGPVEPPAAMSPSARRRVPAADAATGAATDDDSIRDDRGPAPLPEPRDYDLPPDPVASTTPPALVPGDHEPTRRAAAAEAVPEDIESVAARRIRRAAAARASRAGRCRAGRRRSCC